MEMMCFAIIPASARWGVACCKAAAALNALPVCIIPGIFLGFLLQRVGAELHLLVKYGVDFRLGNIASLLTENSRLDFSNRLCSISFIYNGI